MRVAIGKKNDTTKTDQVFKLEDMDVQEVSVVDSAANKRTFLVVKSDTRKDVAPPPAAEQTPPAVPAAPPAPQVAAPPSGAPSGEPTIRIAPEIKDELAKRLAATLLGLEELRKMVDAAEVVQGVVEVPAEIVAAVTKVLTILSEGEVEKAQWTTAYVNDLPDSAFLHIKPGGTKDEEGKTTPRSLRMFPYKDATGAVDLPHLRNALARIPQSSLDQSVKDALATKGKSLLATATKADLEKRLPQLTDTRKAVLTKVRGLASDISSSMDELLAEVAAHVEAPSPAPTPAPPAAPAPPASIGKDAGAIADGVKRLEVVLQKGMTQIAQAQEQVAKAAQVVHAAAATRDTPASPAEPVVVTKTDDDAADKDWPLDMNDGRD